MASGTTTWAAVDAGDDYACALTTGGVAYCWGHNDYRQLGLGFNDQTDRSAPTKVNMPSGRLFKKISAGWYTTCAVADNGKAYCWGRMDYGQVGNNAESVTPTSNPTAVVMPAGVKFVDVSVTRYSACAVGDNSKAYCWGRDNTGQLGNYGGGQALTPAEVPGLTGVTSISAGDSHVCAVANGSVYCWGSDSYDQIGNGSGIADSDGPSLAPLPGGASATSVAAGPRHSCALSTTGAAFCWGEDPYGWLGTGSGSSDPYTKVGTPTAISGGISFSSLSAGGGGPVTCGVRSGEIADGGKGLYCWGSDQYQALGDGSAATQGTQGPSLSPRGVAGLSPTYASGMIGDPGLPVAAVSSGGSFSCALLVSGAIYCWGWDEYGRLGNGAATGDVATPAGLSITLPSSYDLSVDLAGTGSGGVRISPVAAPDAPTCSVDCSRWYDSGTVVTLSPLTSPGSSFTGWSGEGCSGTGSCSVTMSQARNVVATFGPGATWVEIEAGRSHACALTAGGVAYCWGDGYDGGLGRGDAAGTDSGTPVKVTMPAGRLFKHISAGLNSTCAIADNGDAYCWGSNSNGQLGSGSLAASNPAPSVVTMPPGRTFTDIAVGGYTSCALADNGTVWCWGYDFTGSLGNGLPNTDSSVPVQVSGISTAVDVSMEGGHGCALLTGGSVKCWGYDGDGGLGDGGSGVGTNQSAPVSVSLPAGVAATAVSVGVYHVCALTSGEFSAYCWGENTSGAVGNGAAGATVHSPAAVVGGHTFADIAAGSSLTCGVKSLGAAYCWGSDANGELGDGYGDTSSATPQAVYGMSSGVKEVTAGSGFACALLTSGAITCWGLSSDGRIGNGIANSSASFEVPEAFVGVALSSYSATLDLQGTGTGSVSFSPTTPSAATSCSTDCARAYDGGTVVTLTASAAQGSRFIGWSDACTGSSTCTLTMSAARTVVATFDVAPTTFDLSVQIIRGQGAVTGTGINCFLPDTDPSATDCSEAVDDGTSVTLTAVVPTGYRFDAWSSNCDPAVPNDSDPLTCTVAMTEARAVTASFIKTYDLVVQISGQGTVTGTGINCFLPDPGLSKDCSQTLDDGDSVLLTATVPAGYRFGSWSPICDPTIPNDSDPLTCTVAMTAARTVTATFVKTYGLVVSITGQGVVTSSPSGAIDCDSDGDPIDCSQTYDSGDSVTLVAQAKSGWRFDGWSSNCQTPPDGMPDVCVFSMPFSMTYTRTVTATFIKTYDLTVTVVGEGTITSSPAGINCFNPDPASIKDCDATFDTGQAVVLTASAGADYELRNYAGDSCTPTGGSASTPAGVKKTCTITMTQNRSATGYFGRQFDLDVVGSDTVTFAVNDLTQPTFGTCGEADSIACHPVVLDGKTITLTADSDTSDGYELRNYAGAESCAASGAQATAAGVKYSCTITLSSAPGSAIAYFGRQFDLDVVGSDTVTFAVNDLTQPTFGICGEADSIACHPVVLDGKTITLTADSDTADGYELRNYAGDICTDAGDSTSLTNAGEDRVCTITMSGPHSAKTYFGRELRLDVTGSGTVGFAVAGPDSDQPALPAACATTCYGVVLDAKVITLTATPGSNYELRNYAGDTCTPVYDPNVNVTTDTTKAGVAYVCTITMSAPHSAKTYFGRELTLALTGKGTVTFDALSTTNDPDEAGTLGDCVSSGTATCYRVVLDTTSLQLTAAGFDPAGTADDFELRNYAGDTCTPDGLASTPAGVKKTCTITMSAPHSAKTYFGRQLTLALTGKGTVTFDALSTTNDPDEAGTLGDCVSSGTATCYRVVLDTTSLQLTAAGFDPAGTADDYELRNYAGDTCAPVYDPNVNVTTDTTKAGVAYVCTITMSAPHSAKTYFGRQLTLGLTGSGTVNFAADSTNDPDAHTLNPCTAAAPANCYPVVLNGTVLTLSASAAAGKMFAGWADGAFPSAQTGTGDCAEDDTPCQIVMNAPKEEKAFFSEAGTEVLWLRTAGLTDGWVEGGLASGASYTYTLTIKNTSASLTPLAKTILVNFVRRDAAGATQIEAQIQAVQNGAALTCNPVALGYQCPVSIPAGTSTIAFTVLAPYFPIGTYPSSTYPNGVTFEAQFSTSTADGFPASDTARARALVRQCGIDVCNSGTASAGTALTTGISGTGSSTNTSLSGAAAQTSSGSQTVTLGSTLDPSYTTAGSFLSTATITSTATATTTQPTCSASLPASCVTFSVDAPTLPGTSSTSPYYTFRYYWDKATFTDKTTGRLLIDLRYVTLWHLADGASLASGYTQYPRCSTKVTMNCIVSVALLKGSGDLEIVVKTRTNGNIKLRG